MAGMTDKVEIGAFVNQQNQERPKPVRFLVDEQTGGDRGSLPAFNAVLAFAALSLVGGILGLFAIGATDWLDAHVGSQEGFVSVLFLAEIAAGIICFALIARWLRS
ncbi:MAG TPA: hypothetical protein VJZ26_09030 [Blastocatellia bacterium]|nr:hypothetical protein [Blastocatellia bacterium]